MYADDELLALSGIQHFSYCEQQRRLIHLEMVWEDNADTLHGDFFHERVDTTGYSMRDGVRSERSVRVVSHLLGIVGIADIVEYSTDRGKQTVLPIEYKVGRPKVEDWDRLQVTAQAMCLEEMYGCAIEEGALFYGETRRRERVPITQELRESVLDICKRMHEAYCGVRVSFSIEPHKCRRCSLKPKCMPEALNKDAKNYWLHYAGRALS